MPCPFHKWNNEQFDVFIFTQLQIETKFTKDYLVEESLVNVQILQFLLIQKDVTVFNTFISLFLEVLFFPCAGNI